MQIEIRQPGPPLSATPPAAGAILLKFASLPRRDHVYPCVEATIEHRRVHLLLDTGWTRDDIGITPELCSQLFPALQAKHSHSTGKSLSFLAGKSVTREFSGVEWTLGKTHRTSKAFVVSHLQRGMDAVCGLSVFLSNRVTIDYPHGEILLEPD